MARGMRQPIGKQSTHAHSQPEGSTRAQLHPATVEWDVRLPVGDDFAAIGPRAGLQKFRDLVQKAYECKVEAIGPNEGFQKGLRVLGRMINYIEHGLRYEPDP